MMKLPVLGRWKDEAGLRDYIAKNISDLGGELTVINVEHSLANDSGSGGRVDILAKDPFNNFVCIEVKRSDNSARAALNELSKYVVLFCRANDVPKERVRCLLVSTDWKEAHLPISFFAKTSGVDVEGYEAKNENGKVIFIRKDIIEIDFSPKISRSIFNLHFRTREEQKEFFLSVKARIEKTPFVKLAVLHVAPKDNSDKNLYVSIVYIWKIPLDFYPEIERIAESPIGQDHNYPAGYSAGEEHLAAWLLEPDPEVTVWISAEARRGTPEKTFNYIKENNIIKIDRMGMWPSNDVVEDADIVSQMTSNSFLSGGSVQHSYTYASKINPKYQNAYRSEVKRFLDFLSFNKIFKYSAERFLNSFEGDDVVVDISAHSSGNAFYDIYSSFRVGRSQLPGFEIKVSSKGKETITVLGSYKWDGLTVSEDPEKNMTDAYGGVHYVMFNIFGTDKFKSKEDDYKMHGFIPVIIQYHKWGGEVLARGGDLTIEFLDYEDFSYFNDSYVCELVRIFHEASNLAQHKY